MTLSLQEVRCYGKACSATVISVRGPVMDVNNAVAHYHCIVGQWHPTLFTWAMIACLVGCWPFRTPAEPVYTFWTRVVDKWAAVLLDPHVSSNADIGRGCRSTFTELERWKERQFASTKLMDWFCLVAYWCNDSWWCAVYHLGGGPTPSTYNKNCCSFWVR